MKLLAVLACVVAAASALSYYDLVKEEWEAYKMEHQKNYPNEMEDKFRMKIYAENKHKIAKHNQRFQRGLEPFSLQQNKYGDMLHHEFVHTMNGFNRTLKNENTHEKEGRRGNIKEILRHKWYGYKVHNWDNFNAGMAYIKAIEERVRQQEAARLFIDINCYPCCQHPCPTTTCAPITTTHTTTTTKPSTEKTTAIRTTTTTSRSTSTTTTPDTSTSTTRDPFSTTTSRRPTTTTECIPKGCPKKPNIKGSDKGNGNRGSNTYDHPRRPPKEKGKVKTLKAEGLNAQFNPKQNTKKKKTQLHTLSNPYKHKKAHIMLNGISNSYHPKYNDCPWCGLS